MNSFEKKLEWGEEGETQICKWLNTFDEFSVMRVWAKVQGNLQTAPKIKIDGQYYSTPDIQVFQGKKRIFVESKRMTGFTFFRKTQTWQIGIDKAKLMEYRFLQEQLDQQIDLYFIVEGKKVVGTDQLHDSGIYRMNVSAEIDHEWNMWSDNRQTLMVYWNEDQLTKLAEYDEVMSL